MVAISCRGSEIYYREISAYDGAGCIVLVSVFISQDDCEVEQNTNHTLHAGRFNSGLRAVVGFEDKYE
jgi:hypothetical protein